MAPLGQAAGPVARRGLLGFLLALAVASPVATAEVDHSAWDELLRRHVSSEGLVDYAAVQQERQALERYLAVLRDVTPGALGSAHERLAFWINAYNACVFKGVLDHSPLTSVKDVPGFFDKLTHQVGGETLTLNQMEGKGRALGDWRIHCAVVCASSSCPFLRREAYVPDRLDDQLADQVTRFLADPSRGLRVEQAAGVVWVSKIFKWYAKDFVPSGSITAETLLPLLAPFLPDPALPKTAVETHLTVKFMNYDWTLNERRRAP